MWSGTAANIPITASQTLILPTSSGPGSGALFQNTLRGYYLITANVTASLNGVYRITGFTPYVQCSIVMTYIQWSTTTTLLPTMSQATFPPANNANDTSYVNLSVTGTFYNPSPDDNLYLYCSNPDGVGNMNAAFATLTVIPLTSLQVQ
jgi:hypothetical protein